MGLELSVLGFETGPIPRIRVGFLTVASVVGFLPRRLFLNIHKSPFKEPSLYWRRRIRGCVREGRNDIIDDCFVRIRVQYHTPSLLEPYIAASNMKMRLEQ